MSTPSERMIVSALQRATDGFELPPESRWIRERRPTSRVWAFALAAAAALFIVAVGGAVAALREEARVVPASGVDTFAAREDAAWARLRSALPPEFVVLRPTWIPAEFRGSDDCPSPSSSAEQAGGGYATGPVASYGVEYRGRMLPNGRCLKLILTATFRIEERTSVNSTSNDCPQVSTAQTRGTTARVGACVGGATTISWNESGATYEIESLSPRYVDFADLVRIVRGLEPVR